MAGNDGAGVGSGDCGNGDSGVGVGGDGGGDRGCDGGKAALQFNDGRPGRMVGLLAAY